jgi:hypothetical protein
MLRRHSSRNLWPMLLWMPQHVSVVALVPLPHEIPVPVILGSWAIMIGITNLPGSLGYS